MANTKTLYDLLENIKFYTDATSVSIISQATDKEWNFPIDEVPKEFMSKYVARYCPLAWIPYCEEFIPTEYLVILDDKEDFCLRGKAFL